MKKDDNKFVQKSPKILFFHNTLPEYRIGWFTHLNKMCDIEFVFTNEKLNKKNYGFEIDYERVKILKYSFLSEGKKGFKQLKKIIEKIEKYDFVELPPVDSVKEALYSMLIVRQCKKKHVKMGYFWEKWEAPLVYQTLGRRIKNLILRIIPKIAYKNVDVIFSVGEKNKAYFISNGISEEKIEKIPDVSETPECQYIDIRQQYGIPEDQKIILFLGRIIQQKGVDILIKAFAMIQETHNDQIVLLIAGDGNNLQHCKNIVDRNNIRNVIFTGAVEPSLRGNFFSQCDVFVYPVTYYKGRVDVWGLTLNEAIQHRKFVIATDAVGSAYELIVNGENGYRINAQNVMALKSALEKTLSFNLLEKASIIDDKLIQYYNYKSMASEYVKIVNNIVEF